MVFASHKKNSDERYSMNQRKTLQPIVIAIDLTCLILLLSTRSICAQPLFVSVSGSQYTTYVEGVGYPPDTNPETSRTTVSSFPTSDEIDLPTQYSGPDLYITNHAIASAGLSGVSDQTGWGFANAEAVSQLWFSPLADQTLTPNINISARGPDLADRTFTAGQVSLLDLTLNSELWNYSWNAGGSVAVPIQVSSGNNIPWDSDGYTANFNLATDFRASDQYELTMIVCSNAGDDDESVQIRLTGLQQIGLQEVPEPSTGLLLAMSGAALAIYRRCRQSC